MGAFGHGKFADSCMEERRAGAQPRTRVYFALTHDSVESWCEGRPLRNELRLRAREVCFAIYGTRFYALWTWGLWRMGGYGTEGL
jgi:hypothetical protein